MSLYRFEFYQGEEIETIEGIDLTDDDAALTEARRTALEMILDGVLEGYDRSRWLISVTEPSGRSVGIVRFSDMMIPE